MVDVLIDISIYIFLALTTGFIYYNFKAYRLDSRDSAYNDISFNQRVIFLVIHFYGFAILYFIQNNAEINQENLKLVILYGQQFLFIVIFICIYEKLYPKASKLLMNNVFFLLIISYIMLTRISYKLGEKQFWWSIIGALMMLIIPQIIKHKKFIINLQWTYAASGFALLASTLVIGKEKYGSKNWIVISESAGILFQPSEIVKIIYIFFIASLFKKYKSMREIVIGAVVTLMYIGVLFIQKDLGSALIFFVIYMVMLYVVTSNPIFPLGGFLSASLASIIAYNLFSHIKVRVAAWKNPWEDPSGKGWQIAQSLFAIGTGGWLGLGLSRGIPYKIPVVESDFIFAAIAEEFGALFSIGLIFIMFFIFMYAFDIAKKSDYSFFALVAVAISCEYAFQVFLIIGGVTKLIPLTGVTLPFVSYGGSSLLSAFLMLAVLQSLYIIKESETKNSERNEVNGSKR